MRVYIAGEFSGIIRDAFTRAGHYALSCDLLPSETPGNHYQGDWFDRIDEGWDLIIAHPVCTRICNSGVRWLHERNLWKEMEEAALTFKRFLDCKIPKKCVENPIPHKYAMAIIGRKYDQIIQPHMFGHPETKATCLWLENLKKLQPTNMVSGREHRIHRMPPGPDRWRERSRTFPGIGEAMSLQWG